MTPFVSEPEIVYPDCDGKPMADNTLQFNWIVTIQGNLDLLFAHDPTVFVTGDNLIYPVEGEPVIYQAPDVYVAFGREKGYRGSYKVWKEGGVFPQVIFEVLSPNNTAREMKRKLKFYDLHGAEEYYVLDPDRIAWEGYGRSSGSFKKVSKMEGFKSPRLGISFHITDDAEVRYPDGSRFLSFVKLGQLQKETARQAAADRRKAQDERARAEKLAAKLRELGVDPNA